MIKGKTYEIFCKRGLRRDTCRFRQQDPELVCAQCSFAGFIERKNGNWNPEPFTWDVKVNVKNDEQ